MTAFTNPFLGVLVGAAFTGIIQSSAASVGILQALAMTGSVTYGIAIPIIMGQNIGTCVTALISSIGVSRNAKRVSVIHISFNLIGTALGLLALFGGEMFLNLPFLTEPIGAVGIAFCHTIFNVCTTLVLLPFSRQLERLANKVISTEDKPSDFAFLDPRLMRTPGVAVSECAVMTNRMGALALESMQLALAQFIQYDGSPGRSRSWPTRTSWTPMRTVWAAIWSRSLSTAPPPPICAPSPACFTPSETLSASVTTL